MEPGTRISALVRCDAGHQQRIEVRLQKVMANESDWVLPMGPLVKAAERHLGLTVSGLSSRPVAALFADEHTTEVFWRRRIERGWVDVTPGERAAIRLGLTGHALWPEVFGPNAAGITVGADSV